MAAEEELTYGSEDVTGAKTPLDHQEDSNKQDLTDGKPKKNIFPVIIGVALIVVLGMALINGMIGKGEDEDAKKDSDTEKVEKANQKALSVEDLESQYRAEMNQVDDDMDAERRRLEALLAEERAKRQVSPVQAVGDDVFNNNQEIDPKERHREAVMNAGIYQPSNNTSGSPKIDPEKTELERLYEEQNKMLQNISTLPNLTGGDESNATPNTIFQPSNISSHEKNNWLSGQADKAFKRDVAYLEKQQLNTDRLIYEGTVIPVVVSHVASSDFPGKFTTRTTRPIYSRSGKVLLQKGAKLIGAADTNISPGQTRIQAAFYRIINTKGNSIYLSGMQAADERGINAVGGDVNNHYWKIFGSSFGIAIIDSLLTRQNNGSTVNNPTGDVTITAGAQTALGQQANRILDRNLSIQPTITQIEGQQFNIVVTKDIYIDENL